MTSTPAKGSDLNALGRMAAKVDHSSNRTRLEQPRYLILQPKVANHEVACRAVHIERQDLRSISSQQSTDFTTNVPVCARHKHEFLVTGRSHPIILPQAAVTIDTQPQPAGTNTCQVPTAASASLPRARTGKGVQLREATGE